MNRAIIITGLIAATTAGTFAQQTRSVESRAAIEWTAQGGALARTALETRVTRGQPYSADAVTEFVQMLADGNRIVRRTNTRLYRDSEGRTRRENISEGSNAPLDPNTVVITDPVAGVNFILHALNKTAQKAPAVFARVAAGAGGAIARSGGSQGEVITIPSDEQRRATATAAIATLPGRGEVTMYAGERVRGDGVQSAKEDLGQQMVEGVMAVGTRTTTTIAAGAIGNEQPLTIISEQWFSPELEVLVLTRHSDPRVGETTYRLTSLVRSEPDRALFQVPPDYTVNEIKPRQPSVMWRKQQ